MKVKVLSPLRWRLDEPYGTCLTSCGPAETAAQRTVRQDAWDAVACERIADVNIRA